MTLALYGKSRRRKGALLIAALLAVIVATVGALGAVTSAFAHHSTHEITGTCDSWTYKANFYGGGESGTWRKVEVYSRTPGGSWNLEVSKEFDGKSDVTPFFTKDGSGSIEFKIEMYKKGDKNRTVNSDGEEPNNVLKDCDRTITIKKVTTGKGAPKEWTFTGTISDVEPKNWKLTDEKPSVSYEAPKGEDIEVTEDAPGDAWVLVGYQVKKGNDEKCSSKESDYTPGNSAQVKADDNDYTVCILNQWTGKTKIQVHKYVPGKGQGQDWQNQGVGQGNWKYTIYSDNSGAKGSQLPGSPNPFGHLTPSVPFEPQTVWITETDTGGMQFYGWYLPEDPSSGNPKCNSVKDKDIIKTADLKVEAKFFDVPGDQTGVYHICAYNKPKDPEAPTVSKVAGSPGYQPGYARWTIKVVNTNSVPIQVQVNDSGVQNDGSITGGTCSDGDISDGKMTCTVNANATLKIPVKKAVAQQCEEGKAENTASIEWRKDDKNNNNAEWSQPLTATGASITIPADPSKCDKPGITKTLVQNGSSQTTDPNAIAWLVTVTNPATGSNGTTQTVYIKDQNVTVVGTPALSGGALCVMPVGSSFEQELNGASGVQCSMPNSSSITFTVKPKPAPQRACEDQVFTNTAYLYVGSTTADPITAQGPAITLLGDKSLCKRDITICKFLEDNGDGIGKKSQLFTVYVKYDSQTTEVQLVVDEGGAQACGNVTVPANANVEVGEKPTRQEGWNGDAGDYPKVTQDGNTYTVTNKEKPITVEVTFVKKVCDTFKDVPRNNGSNLNHIGAPYFPGMSENDLGTAEGNCKEVTGWNFQLWTGNSSNTPWPGNAPTGTLLGTYSTGTHTLAPNVVAELSKSPQRLLVTEVYQPGYAFAALKCEGDNINQDNWEWLYWSQVKDDGKITCTAYNVPATKQITIQKTFYGASQVSQADYPTFTISNGVDFATACTGPTLSVTNPVTATWTCTVPYLWNGTVTETPATGWERCAVVSAQVAGNGSQTQRTFEFTNCKQPQIVVKKVVTNVDNDTTQFSVTLSGGQSSQTGQIAEWDGSGPVNATFSNLSTGLGNTYTVVEQAQNGYQVLGWAYATENGTCPAPQSYNGQAAAEVSNLNPGETKVICFYNERFSRVVVDKQAPSGAVPPGTTFNWTISVSVTDGPTSSALTLTDTLPSGFTYGSITATSPLSCTLSSGTLSCTLPQNTPIGTYTVTIPATVPTNTFEICGDHTNTVTFSGAGTQPGTDDATVTIGCTASDGRILVKKVVRGQPGDTTQFTAELTGPGITGTATQPFSQQNIGFFLGLAAGTFSVGEQPKAGYDYAGWAIGTIVGESVQCPANPTGAGSASVTLTNLAPQAAVCFYNDARVTIRVHKTLNVIGFTSNGQGWQFTLTGCGITPQTKTTDANGIAEFTNLPPAIACSYTVTETTQAGWTPQFVSQTAQPTQGGQVVTLEFLNIRVFDPPCTDPNDPRCAPPPSSTPPTTTTTPPTGTATNTPTPTATPTNTPTPTPTNTPTPTPTNTPVTQVAGERTPGPGTSPTPLAPATGFGFGQGEGGMSLLLVLAGLVSLSLGLGFLALGRRRTDR